MTGAGWHIRPGRPGDRELLASFACADPAVRWQAEAEQFIQAQLTDWAFDPHADDGDPRLLLAFTAAGDLFGVAAHERVTLQAGDGTSFPATKLEVVGVALKWQGRSFPTGERASDVLMSSVMTDVSSRIPAGKVVGQPEHAPRRHLAGDRDRLGDQLVLASGEVVL
jgi:hypothetical protein